MEGFSVNQTAIVMNIRAIQNTVMETACGIQNHAMDHVRRDTLCAVIMTYILIIMLIMTLVITMKRKNVRTFHIGGFVMENVLTNGESLVMEHCFYFIKKDRQHKYSTSHSLGHEKGRGRSQNKTG